ncbi:MAG TPA: hypothetical protein VHE34_25010 [Puia sp.]|uniref:hypothetical protein n=1 Tax=Puia sp. TaxID=2045100 RepID=UPI002C0AECBA|nr:hypothetical protein [Puia sp.]HVU98515.1 hypothetical protein [Puia sp.]
MTHEKTAIRTRTKRQKHPRFFPKKSPQIGCLTHDLTHGRLLKPSPPRHIDLPQSHTANTELTRIIAADIPIENKFPAIDSDSIQFPSLSATYALGISGKSSLPFFCASTGMAFDTIFFTLQNAGI